jgi:hypothetical protein
MRILVILLLLFWAGFGSLKVNGQQPIFLDSITNIPPLYLSLVLNAMEYHQALVKGDVEIIKNRTIRALRYGHSNGWIESQKEQIKNLKSGYLIYHSYKEDSVNIMLAKYDFTINGHNPMDVYNKNNAVLVFNATIDVSLQGKRNTYHLKVAERWIRKTNPKKGWRLVGRNATKL